MEKEVKPKILCVDDEPNVVATIAQQLRRGFEVKTATSGAEALEVLKTDSFAVIISDMRMPGMDGATFLAQAREQAPEAVRMLLTGQTELNAAIAAVNQGQIFRFLTKPCLPPDLRGAVSAAFEQHRLITAERELLEHTLVGSIKTLTDILSLSNPAAFGRAVRLRQAAEELVDAIDVDDGWKITTSAMLSQIGCVTLPSQTVSKLYDGQDLNCEEQEMVAKLPELAEQLLANIPRLESIREILAYQDRRFEARTTQRFGKKGEAIPIGARILKIVHDFDMLEARLHDPDVALATMEGRNGDYDPVLLKVFSRLRQKSNCVTEVREVLLTDLRIGMMLVDDIKASTGTLLVARGNEITHSLLTRLRNLPPRSVKEPVRVMVGNGRLGV